MRTHLYDRIGEGEEIYFLLGAELDDALVVACSAGALEVAYPPAYLRGETLSCFEPRHLAPRAPMPKAGSVRFRRWIDAIPASEDPRVPVARSVVLIDDGLLPTPDLVVMASSLRNAAPRQLTVAAPWLSVEALAALRCIADKVHPSRRRPEPTWYREPPDADKAARLLTDVLGRRRWKEDDENEATPETPCPVPAMSPGGEALCLTTGAQVPGRHRRRAARPRSRPTG